LGVNISDIKNKYKLTRDTSLPTKNISLKSSQKLRSVTSVFFFFLIGIVAGGVQLGPLGTAAINRPIVPAPCDYDDGKIGGMIGRGNRSIRRKHAPLPFCPPQTSYAARTRT
jgi:hypothetical protein